MQEDQHLVLNDQVYCECDSFDCQLKISISWLVYKQLTADKKFIVSNACETPDDPDYKLVEQTAEYKIMEVVDGETSR